MKIAIILIIFSFFVLFSCENHTITEDTITEDINNDDNSNDSSTEQFSIVRKWYTNAEDDRYYFDFKTDGTLYHRYYQNIGSQTSTLNSFVTKIGTWSYLNVEQTRFSVGWDDSIDCYYNIEDENLERLLVSKDLSGPVGRGLGDTTELLKSANVYIYTIPDEIEDLIGTWYYDDTKDGKYLKIQTDGICYYHYYQDYGINSGLTGWVNIKGIWSYNTDTENISITMSGEITYSYDIVILNTTNLQISGSTNSMISNQDLFYK